jgi:uncharacterized protein (DUF488 family)
LDREDFRMANTPIFTIGHSTHPLEDFVILLRQHRIEFVIDVRSTPYSRRMPQFNKENLQLELRDRAIRYAHMPNEFGARRTEAELYGAERRVDFGRVRDTDIFRRGVERLKHGAAQGCRIALMCSEADPFDCHRFSMISYQLAKEGLRIKHILRNGALIDNSALEERLREHYKFTSQADMFNSEESEAKQIEQAYRLRGEEIAYSTAGEGA